MGGKFHFHAPYQSTRYYRVLPVDWVVLDHLHHPGELLLPLSQPESALPPANPQVDEPSEYTVKQLNDGNDN